MHNKAAYNNVIIIFLHFGKHNGIHFSAQPIVAVNKAYVFARSGLNSAVACRGCAAVFFVYNFYTSVVHGVVITYCTGTVGRTVIDKNKLKIAEGLLCYAVKTVAKIFFGVIYGYDYA